MPAQAGVVMDLLVLTVRAPSELLAFVRLDNREQHTESTMVAYDAHAYGCGYGRNEDHTHCHLASYGKIPSRTGYTDDASGRH